MSLTRAVLCSIQEKLWSRAAGNRLGCMPWLKHCNKDGYGEFQFRFNGEKRKILAHRAAYIIVRGDLDESVVLRHECNTRCCINPWHLLPGTHDDNVQDMVSQDRQAKGSTNGRAVLVEADIPIIRAELARGTSRTSLATRFGVDRKIIYLIERGEIWKHV